MSITSNQNNSFVFKGWGYGTMFLVAPFASPTFAVAQGRTGKNKILKAGINTRGLVGWYA
ncbi:hypothetical protein ABW365_17820 [Enterococcus avium]